MKTTTKRVWLAALVLVISAGVGACADEPMAVEAEETFEPQADGTGNCVIINGQLHCS